MQDLLYNQTRFLIRLIWKYLPNSAAETYPIYLISNLVLSVLGLVVCFLIKQWPVNWPIQQAIFVVRTALEMLDMSKAIGDSVADSVSLINQSTKWWLNHHFTTWAAQYQANPWYPLDHCLMLKLLNSDLFGLKLFLAFDVRRSVRSSLHTPPTLLAKMLVGCSKNDSRWPKLTVRSIVFRTYKRCSR